MYAWWLWFCQCDVPQECSCKAMSIEAQVKESAKSEMFLALPKSVNIFAAGFQPRTNHFVDFHLDDLALAGSKSK